MNAMKLILCTVLMTEVEAKLPSFAELREKISDELVSKVQEYIRATIEFEQYILMIRSIRRHNHLQNNKKKYPEWNVWSDIPEKYKVELTKKIEKRNKWADRTDQLIIATPETDEEKFAWLFNTCPLSQRISELDADDECKYQKVLNQKSNA